MKNALILSGGGARAAYQVGVLKAIKEIIPTKTNPFPIICGTSAGAINAVSLASRADDFAFAVDNLESFWGNLTTDHVFKSDWWSVSKGGLSLFASLFNQGIGKNKPISLLNNDPLRDFLSQAIKFDSLDSMIEKGALEAICVTAMGYTTGESISFFQNKSQLNNSPSQWRRHRRVGQRQQLTVEHLMASSAIPTVFPTVKLGDQYFGDGAMRQLAPISPALHLGADRVFVIGVSGNRNPTQWHKKPQPLKHSPSIAQIIGHMFNSAFIDSLEGDIEHLDRVNDLLKRIPDIQKEESHKLRPIESLVISPSKALDKIAGRNVRYLPPSLKYFFRSTGATASGGGAAAASYLLFCPEYSQELMDLGYKDAMWERGRIEEFFDC